MSFLMINLAQVGLSIAQVGCSFAQVAYLRRLLSNPTFNRSKAKISLPSYLAFRKYLNLYVVFGAKTRTGRVITPTGRVLPRISLTFGDFFQIYFQPEQSYNDSSLMFRILKVLKLLFRFWGYHSHRSVFSCTVHSLSAISSKSFF